MNCESPGDIDWLKEYDISNVQCFTESFQFGPSSDHIVAWDVVLQDSMNMHLGMMGVLATMPNESLEPYQASVTEDQKLKIREISTHRVPVMERVINPFWAKPFQGDVSLRVNVSESLLVEVEIYKNAEKIMIELPVFDSITGINAMLTYGLSGDLIEIVTGMPEDRFDPYEVDAYTDDEDFDMDALDEHTRLDVEYMPVVSIQPMKGIITPYDRLDDYYRGNPSKNYSPPNMEEVFNNPYDFNDGLHFILLKEDQKITGFQWTRPIRGMDWKVRFPGSFGDNGYNTLLDAFSMDWVKGPWSEFEVHYKKSSK